MPYIGKSPHFGVRNRFIYTASADDTSVSGADANGATLTFADGAYVDVYLNGILLKAGTDYVTTTANTIGSLAALSTSDEVVVLVYDVFSVSDTVSAASGGTFSGAVNLNGGAVFNEDSADVDFRVESDGLTHALFVDGGNDSVLIGMDDVAYAVTNEADNLIVGNPSDAITGMTFVTSATGYSSINFSDANSGDGRVASYLAYNHNTNVVWLGGKGNGTTLLNIHADGRWEQKGCDSDNGPAMLVFNDGNNANRKGMIIQCGTDDNSGTNYAISFDDGDGGFQDQFTSKLGQGGDNYTFDYILSLTEGRNVPIVNYAFDNSGTTPSLILKLSKPLPSGISNLTEVHVEKEVMTTNIQDIYYVSDVLPTTTDASGLNPDTSIDIYGEYDNNDFQSFNQIASSGSSLTNTGVESFLISGSDTNLNIDYNSFSNHTFFGSATKKLENFYTKVSTIEDYYTEISSSLQQSASAVVTGEGHTHSPNSMVNRRKDLFDKIQTEINSFTPYERFLYYDAQSQTTASAPSLGVNYAHNPPTSAEAGDKTTLTDFDGLGTVYKYSDEYTDDP